MNVYPSAVDALMRGEIDLEGDTIKALMVTGYLYVPAHTALDDVPGGVRVETPVTLSARSVAAGYFRADAVVFPEVPAGPDITAVVIYKAGGSEATSPLLAFHDKRGDQLPLSVTPNGGNVTFDWPARRLFRL